jgi:hypothetical protein
MLASWRRELGTAGKASSVVESEEVMDIFDLFQQFKSKNVLKVINFRGRIHRHIGTFGVLKVGKAESHGTGL